MRENKERTVRFALEIVARVSVDPRREAEDERDLDSPRRAFPRELVRDRQLQELIQDAVDTALTRWRKGESDGSRIYRRYSSETGRRIRAFEVWLRSEDAHSSSLRHPLD